MAKNQNVDSAKGSLLGDGESLGTRVTPSGGLQQGGAPPPTATAIGLELGAAAQYALLDLGTTAGGTAHFEQSKSTVNGPVGLAGSTIWDEMGQSTINGNVTYSAGVTRNASSKSVLNGTYTEDDAGITKAVSNALTAAAFFKNLTATLPTSDFGGASGALPSGGTVTGHVGYNVVDLSSLSANGGTFTLSGAAGTEFVIDVSGGVTFGGGFQLVETGGITAADVIINETGSADVMVSGAGVGTLINAVVLAPTSNITFDGNVTGAVIGGQNKTVTLTSGITVTHSPGLVCFVEGTTVATPSGEAAVETLARGDRVLTSDGGDAPVLWVGRQTVSTTFADPLRTAPIRIKAGALGDAQPSRDLLVSPCHAVLVDGILVQAAALVNGASIVRETHTAETFTYYHVELEDHSLILAEGVPAETFIDNVERMAFDNWQEHVALYPAGRQIEESPLPRAQSARQVPASIKARLAERAAASGASTALAA